MILRRRSLIPSGPVPWAYDDFNRPNNEFVTTNWVEATWEGFQILNGKATPDIGNEADMDWHRRTNTNYCYAECTIDMRSVDDRFYLRICGDSPSGIGNGYDNGYEIRCNEANNTIYLRREGITVTTVATGGYIWTEPHVWRIEHDGSGRVQVWLDGVEVIDYTDGSPLSGDIVGISGRGVPGSLNFGPFEAGDL